MFNLVEIDKIYTYEEGFTPVSPYIFSTSISVIASEKDNYWTNLFGAENNYNSVKRQVNSVTINYETELTQQDSYEDMESQENSFYFDFDTQLLYVHVDDETNLMATNPYIGIMTGYTTDTVRYFNNQEYIPIVTSIPSISQSADPLEYEIISFISASVELANPVIDGEFLFNGNEKLYGNTVRIYRGTDGDSYGDLIKVFDGYISNLEVNTESVTISLGDNREKLEIDYPTAVFETDEDDDLVGDTNDELIPDGYGNVVQVPAYPVVVGSTSVRFRWATVATSITSVYTYTDDEGLIELSSGEWGVSDASPLASGYFYILNANIYVDGDTENSLKDVYVTGRMRDYDNPADIIASLNSVVLGIEYNDSNYDTAEWESEKTMLADVALYMDKSKSLYEWIEDLQSGSDYGFRYEDFGKRTIRVDYKDRDAITFADGTTTIEPIDIRDSDISIDQNADLYASSVIVKYNKNHRKDTHSQTTNDDHYNDVIREFRVASIATYTTLLVNESDAISKASMFAEDESTVRPLVTLVVESSKYTQPRIYDIINATASLLVQSAYQSDYTNVLADADGVLGDDEALGELWGLTVTEAESMGTIEYYGEFVGEVLDIEPNTDNDTVSITLRDITDLRS